MDITLEIVCILANIIINLNSMIDFPWLWNNLLWFYIILSLLPVFPPPAALYRLQHLHQKFTSYKLWNYSIFVTNYIIIPILISKNRITSINYNWCIWYGIRFRRGMGFTLFCVKHFCDCVMDLFTFIKS